MQVKFNIFSQILFHTEHFEGLIPLEHEVPESTDSLLVAKVKQMELGTEALFLKQCHCSLMKMKVEKSYFTKGINESISPFLSVHPWQLKRHLLQISYTAPSPVCFYHDFQDQ